MYATPGHQYGEGGSGNWGGGLKVGDLTQGAIIGAFVGVGWETGNLKCHGNHH